MTLVVEYQFRAYKIRLIFSSDQPGWKENPDFLREGMIRPIFTKWIGLKSEVKKKVKTNHSMARANLNKSEVFFTNTTTATKYIPRRSRICIDWNISFQSQIYLVKVPLNVHIVKQDFLHKKLMLQCYLLRRLHSYSDWLWPYCETVVF